VTDIENRLANLSADRIKALVGKLKQGPSGPAPMPRNPAQRYPLSSSQERMWFLEQLSPDSKAFNNPIALRARTAAPLDCAQFERAVNAVVARHEILRTTFHAVDGIAKQVVHAEMAITVAWDDLRALPPAEREAKALALAVAEGRRDFDLAVGPLLAIKLVHIDELDYLLLLTSHHIISDGWSNALLCKEISALYLGAVLPPLKMQYVDYVHWEHGWLGSEACRTQLAYWRDRLDPDQAPLPMPVDRPRPLVMTHAGAMETVALPRELSSRLREFAKAERASLFHVLAAMLLALLHRLTGEDNISLGTSTANRDQRHFQDVMGPFINTLVIRTAVAGDTSLRQLVHQARAVCQDALLHQELPFEKLINELKPRRDLGVHPLFQVMFVHQNMPIRYELPGMSMQPVKVDYQATKFDLNLWTEEVNEDLLLTLYYARDLFESTTARQLLDYYRRALESLLEQPDMAVKDVPCFPADKLGLADAPPVGEHDFISRFESQVQRTPDAPAVEGADGTLSYADLAAAADHLARRLRRRGAGSGRLVALLVQRGTAMVIGLLGIMKAGAAYLPLDPSHPTSRWRTLIEDAGATLMVSERQVCKPGLAVETIVIDEADEGAPDEVPLTVPAPADPAYLIYTSGTTGRPKGVCVEHRHLVAYCDAVWTRMRLASGDRFATVSSLAADLGNTAIFPPLMHGGCVVVVPEDLVTDAAGLAAFFARRPIDCLKIVPSHLRALLAGGDVLPRKLLVLGGEAADGELIAAVRSRAPGRRILNHYGPTETTVGVLTYEIPDPWDGGAPPLGQPLTGAKVVVLDRHGQPLPAGVVGELAIGGATVSRGYWNQPELTAERFLPDPVQPGGRLYRTGDMGKRRPDGTIVFLGRADRQIKLRGYRVELGEIEAALARHPSVTQAVVQGNAHGQLVAHVRTKEPVPPEALADFLRGCLPSYMIPAAVVFIEDMPLTTNGKIDYAALAKSPAKPKRPTTSAPRDEIELDLALIWQDLLGRDEVGIDDDFFDVGGHSLLAMQLMARIGRRWGRALPLACLFEHGTIAGLADLLREDAPPSPRTLVSIQPKGSGSPLVFVHPAGGNVLCYYGLAQALGTTRPFHALQAHVDGGEATIAGMARRYLEALPPGPMPVLGGWSMGALVAFEMATLYARRHGQQPPVAVLDQLAPAAHPGAAEGEDDLSRMVSFARKVSELVGQDIGLDRNRLESQDPEGRAAAFLAGFKRHGLAPASASVDAFRRYLDLMLAHNRATTDYRPTVYGGRVVVFRADQSLSFDAGLAPERSSDLGWGRWSANGAEVVAVPGNHVTMMREPNVGSLATRLAESVLPRPER
jgi:amino acid adenylation domain-containing protein